MTVTKSGAVFMAVVIVLAAITVFFGYTGYALHGFLDSIFFMPAAVSSAVGQGFANHITDLRSSWGDPTGQERYLYFPPLFPLLVGYFISGEGAIPPPQQAFLIVGAIVALTVLLASFVFYKIATLHGRRFDFFSAALISAILVVILRSLWVFMARPEALENLLLVSAFLVAFFARRPRQIVIGFGVVLGLMASTHPFGALFFAAFVGLFFSFFYEHWRRVVAYIASTYISGFVVSLLALQISPYGIGDTVSGVLRHASIEAQRISFDKVSSFVGNPYAILYGIVMLLIAAFCGHFYLRYRTQIKTLPLFVFFAATVAVLVVYFVIAGVKTYYASLFSMLIFPMLVYYLVHVSSRRFIKNATLLFLVLFALLSLKPVFAFPSFVQNGMTIAEARQAFAPVAARYPEADIFIAAHLWVLSEDYERMHYIGDITPEAKVRRPLVLVLDQTYGYGDYSPGTTPPAEAEGCPLKENYFIDKVPEFLGVKVSSAMPGYGFAAYVCE